MLQISMYLGSLDPSLISILFMILLENVQGVKHSPSRMSIQTKIYIEGGKVYIYSDPAYFMRPWLHYSGTRP